MLIGGSSAIRLSPVSQSNCCHYNFDRREGSKVGGKEERGAGPTDGSDPRRGGMAVAPPPSLLRVRFRTHQKDMAIRLERQANRRELGRKTKMRGVGVKGRRAGRRRRRITERRELHTSFILSFFNLHIYLCASR